MPVKQLPDKLGSYLREQTKIPLKNAQVSSPAVQEHIMMAQQLIKEFELVLMEKAYDGDEAAIDALLFANVASMGISVDKVGSVASEIKSVKETGKEQEKSASSNIPPGAPISDDDPTTVPGSPGETKPGKWIDGQFSKDKALLDQFKDSAKKDPDDIPEWLKEGWFAGDSDTSGEVSPSFSNKTYQNTYGKLKNSEDAGEWWENLFNDCIPCGWRLANLAELDPWGDLVNSLAQWLEQIIRNLMALWNMLRNMTWMDEFCALLEFLNFLCIPDLYSILALLQAYVYQIITSIMSLFSKGTFSIIWGLLSPLFVNIMTDLSAILDAWIQAIMAPINCVIGSLLTQLEKLGGSSGTGIKEIISRGISPSAYQTDAQGNVLTTIPTEQTSTWKKAYSENTDKLIFAKSEYNAAKFRGDVAAANKYSQEVAKLEAEQQEILGQKHISWEEEKLKRQGAIRRALSSGTTAGDQKRRKEGFKDLDAEGWLIMVGQLTSKTLYFVAGYILEARDSLNGVINDLKDKLMSWLTLLTNSTQLKILALDKLKKIMKLIALVTTILNIIKEGKLLCGPEGEENESPSESVVSQIAEAVTGKKQKSSQEDQLGATNDQLIKVYDDNDELVGYQMTAPDFDPISGAYVPLDQNGNSILDDKITISDKTDLKIGTFIPLSSCLTTTMAEQRQFREDLRKIVNRSKELGIA